MFINCSKQTIKFNLKSTMCDFHKIRRMFKNIVKKYYMDTISIISQTIQI